MKRAVAALVAGACWVGMLAANPMPMEEHWSGGRLVPAMAVPVDILHESLSVDIGPAPRQWTQGGKVYTSHWWDSRVTARYELAADEAVTVPIVFPFTGQASNLRFGLNGRAVPARLLSTVDLLQPYADTWRRAVELAIARDAHLRAAVAEIRARRTAAVPLEKRDSGDLWFAAVSFAGGWLRQRAGVGAESDLADFLCGSPIADNPLMPAGPLAELSTLRRLALAVDPRVPDPLALAEAASGTFTLTAAFATADLPLRQGAHDLVVGYTQPVGSVNRLGVELTANLGPDGRPMPASRLLPAFGYIVRTASHWRRFGTLDVTVRLPRGTRQVECSEPTAKATLDERPPTVRWSVSGVPAKDIEVIFDTAAFQPGDGLYFRGLPPEPTAPRVRPTLRWIRLLGHVSEAVCAGPSVDRGRVLVCRGRTGWVYEVADGALRHTLELPFRADEARLTGDRVVIVSRPDTQSAAGPGPAGWCRAAACLDLAGAVLWRAEIPVRQDAPLCMDARGDLLFLWRFGGALALRLSDGREQWRSAADVVDVAPDATDAGVLYVAQRNGGGARQQDGPLAIAAWGEADGLPRWTWQGQGSTAVVRLDPAIGLLAVLATAEPGRPWRFLALRSVSGTRIWDRDLPAEQLSPLQGEEDVVYRSPALTLAGSAATTVVTYRDDGRPGKVESFPYQTQSMGAAVRSGSRFYVPTMLGLDCFDQGSGGMLWRSASPAQHGRVALSGGRLICFSTLGATLSVADDPGPGALPPLDNAVPEHGAVPADLVKVLAPR